MLAQYILAVGLCLFVCLSIGLSKWLSTDHNDFGTQAYLGLSYNSLN